MGQGLEGKGGSKLQDSAPQRQVRRCNSSGSICSGGQEKSRKNGKHMKNEQLSKAKANAKVKATSLNHSHSLYRTKPPTFSPVSSLPRLASPYFVFFG